MSTEASVDRYQPKGEGLIVLYDNLLSAPRIIRISPVQTADFIESLASRTYELSHEMGGAVPYTIIREVTENFIHAAFEEVVISVLDNGNTIRFSDQGPGIPDKQKARQPGFTSATREMKSYIRGVGSGLPIVNEYLDITNGDLVIDDNIDHGAVVTISLRKETAAQAAPTSPEVAVTTEPVTEPAPKLTTREQAVVDILAREGDLGVSAIARLCSIPLSSTHALLKKLEDEGVIHTTTNQKKRALTPLGSNLVSQS